MLRDSYVDKKILRKSGFTAKLSDVLNCCSTFLALTLPQISHFWRLCSKFPPKISNHRPRSSTQTPPIPFLPLPLIGSSPPLQDNQKVHIYSEPGGTIVCIQRHLRLKKYKNRLLLILIWDYYCCTVVNLL